MRKPLLRILPFLLLGAALLGSAYGQGILVRPMSAEATVVPGKTYDFEFQVQNTLTDQRLDVDATVQYLSQNEEGWVATPAEEAKADLKQRFPSCFSWIKLDRPTTAINPLQTEKFTLRIAVPTSAKGFYSAAFIVASRPPAARQGIGVVVRFLLPILLRVEGYVPPRKISVGESQIRSILRQDERPGITQTSVLVRNEGGAIARIGGRLDLYGLVGTQWLKVSSGDLVERRILPNAALRLTATFSKQIPGGKYRVVANLVNESQKIPRYTQEIDAEGDAAVGKIVPDVPIVVTPAVLTVDTQPEALRSATVSVRNPGDDPVTVRLGLETPIPMQGQALGDRKSEDYVATPFTQFAASEVTIAPKQERKVRIAVQLPAGAAFPRYYSTVVATAFINGQPAGTTRSLVEVVNRVGELKPAAQPLGPIQIASLGKGRYNITAGFANIGNVSLDPKVEATVVRDAVSAPLARMTLTGTEGPFLPITNARFSGVLNAQDLPVGQFSLTAELRSGTTRTLASILIRVSAQGPNRVISLVAAKPQGGK